ncbi:hypothetical protein SIM91_06485 [Rhodococcus opacus]|uniref:hypothetical protein n=1 Tax=Rhodococcus opacus TaxID=37919 RepID=UPI0002A43A60|nr:hypothetical protein [Rhodococcus opacus]ELB87517.1 hypothetical protein Rwratislav_39485 [Rhodococcus wratislaviensis IFP 2016]MDX5962959.1 hypothetical protein [Rhodococcus opacus]NKY69828.1 hypothetical protein [Rhodococcus opacus]CAG7599872.1 hypothetical protein E143388_04797 [Rhodococcus opacus]
MQSIPDQLYDMAAQLPDAIAEGHLISVTRLEVRLSAPLGNLSATLGDDAANQQLNNRRGLLFRQECPPSRCGTRGIVSNSGRADGMIYRMSERIEQIERKLARANRYLNALEDELRQFDKDGVRAEQETVAPEATESGFGFAIKVRFNRPLDPEWEITLGEVAYQARSALDQLVTAAVVANGGDVSDHRGAFPIFSEESDYLNGKRSNRDRLLAGVPEPVAKVIDDLQPFRASDPFKHPLYVVNAVCNGDKHRDGQPSLVRTRRSALAFEIPSANTITVFAHDEIPPGHAGVGQYKDGDDLMLTFSEAQLRSMADDLARKGVRDADGIQLVGVNFVTAVCFGSRNIFSFQLRESLRYIESEVLGRIAPLITHV